MKSQSFYTSLLLCILAFTRFLTIAAESCIDFPNPLNPTEKKVVNCPPTANTNANVKRQTSNFFQVTHNCTASAVLCDKIKEAFNDAGKEISKILNLKQIIYIDATFTILSPSTLLGSANSARWMTLTSDDNVLRLYPQALVKQFSLDVHPEYNAYDITAAFNAGQEWWFKTDNETIKSNQNDFYAVILHELLHGLGFVPSWNDALEPYDNRNVTGLTPSFAVPDNSIYNFTGFTETIYDRYVKFIRNNEESTSTNYTFQLNEAVSNGTSFNTYSEFVTKIKSSPQWKYAEFALTSATTNDSLYFTPAKDASWKDVIYLESSLNPFYSGASMSHVSNEKYNSTSDFLMTYYRLPGETLETTIQKTGNYKSPIGPRLVAILESIGYETDYCPNSIKPTYKY